uniref:Uncharacterized protein n=1 Tax=Varanus komodoensis TaxID=61221 RepID=A0A8D2L5S5_VARKO
MAQAETNLDHDLPLLSLPVYWAKTVVGLLSLICFVNSYDGDFVFDDSEAIINNKVSGSLSWILALFDWTDLELNKNVCRSPDLCCTQGMPGMAIF